MVLIRLAKVAMIGSLAAYAFIVAYDNVVDYDSNYEFVRHVLSMDTTFPGNALTHRAITNESVWRVAYALIIAMEGLTPFCWRWARRCCLDDSGRLQRSSTAPKSGP